MGGRLVEKGKCDATLRSLVSESYSTEKKYHR